MADPCDPANLSVPYADLQACAAEVMRLEQENVHLSRELAEANTRLAGALALLPDDTLCGDLQRAALAFKQQLAESERLAAARNKLNGELAMEGERLREALRKYGAHYYGCRFLLDDGGGPYTCTCGLDAALTAQAPRGAG
jgi:hypothetical protein